jgi:hypothetical protein
MSVRAPVSSQGVLRSRFEENVWGVGREEISRVHGVQIGTERESNCDKASELEERSGRILGKCPSTYLGGR